MDSGPTDEVGEGYDSEALTSRPPRQRDLVDLCRALNELHWRLLGIGESEG